MHFDVFNGDADGICSMIQLRLAEPQPDALVVTGPKRDIELVGRVVPKEGDVVTVCDISLARNRDEVLRVLAAGATVDYFDHHDPGQSVEHVAFRANIETHGETCTSVIVDRYLEGSHRDWAIVGAFGDNMNALAGRLAKGRDVDAKALRELGNLVNYNGYGASLDDLHYHPEALYRMMAVFAHPQDFLAEDDHVVPTLREGYNDDLAAAEAGHVLLDTEARYIARLPDTRSSRRIAGILGNRLASANPDRAHAVLVNRGVVIGASLRAPIATRRGALALAKLFGGGGREAAAGIDGLTEGDIPRFVDAFRKAFA